MLGHTDKSAYYKHHNKIIRKITPLEINACDNRNVIPNHRFSFCVFANMLMYYTRIWFWLYIFPDIIIWTNALSSIYNNNCNKYWRTKKEKRKIPKFQNWRLPHESSHRHNVPRSSGTHAGFFPILLLCLSQWETQASFSHLCLVPRADWMSTGLALHLDATSRRCDSRCCLFLSLLLLLCYLGGSHGATRATICL